MKSKYGCITNTNITFFLQCLKENEFSLFLSNPPDRSIPPVTYTFYGGLLGFMLRAIQIAFCQFPHIHGAPLVLLSIVEE